MRRVLVTGGAGFIGTHLVDGLVRRDHDVVVLDCLHPQVHGRRAQHPARLAAGARLVVGDVRDRSALAPLVERADVVVHLAALTGVGQSMYQISDYVDVNVTGTAILLEAMRSARAGDRKLVVASSRAIYGEGAYRCAGCGPVVPPPRRRDALAAGRWDPTCPACGDRLVAAATAEASMSSPSSVYAITKLAQEQAVLTVAQASGFPAVALRLFNVYGPGQSARNPYTGVITAFLGRALNGLACDVYEDGLESRDFVHVADAVTALLLAIEHEVADGAYNVGTGRAVSLFEAAKLLAGLFGVPDPVISGRYRVGDIRHCWADLARSQSVLGYLPSVPFEDGLRHLAAQVAGQGREDVSELATAELAAEGLAGVALEGRP